jgi:hypothetical protein
LGAGVREPNAGGEREQPGADKVGRRGSIREARTPQHVLGRVLASLVCEEEACAVVSMGRPKAASMSSLERVGMSVAWPRRRAPWWHTGVFACVRACGRSRALTWPDARGPRRRKDVLDGVVKQGDEVVAIWVLWFRSSVQGDGWVGAGECRWLGHDGESKKDGVTVTTRAKPRATKMARRRGSSRSVDVPHAGMCVRAVGQSKTRSVKRDARALIG